MREAVAAIFVYQHEIFIIQRQNYLRAFPGYYAFPGGKVDIEDNEYVTKHPLLTRYPGRWIGALFREVQEELGFNLELAVNAGSVKAIDHFGEAITPPFEPVRFNAHYFKVEMTERPDLVVDKGEIAWAGWIDHKELHRRFCAGNALMVIPTMNTVRALAEDISALTTEHFNLEYDVNSELPYLELLYGVGMIPVPSNTLPPAKTSNALVLGDGRAQRYLIDPSPESKVVYQQLVETLKQHRVDGIFITHHHPDHHEFSPELARELRVPLRCSEKTQSLMLEKYGRNYLQGVDVKRVEEGDVLTTWLGLPVRCYALPGHDAGMLGLAPDNMAWFFVADLAQFGATVVIPSGEGDMTDYFKSLERVIKLEPKVVIPSHGMPMGGTLLLEKTLQHRRKREEQIQEYLAQGLSPESMVEKIYQDIDPKLLSLALQNVKQHINKLKNSVE